MGSQKETVSRKGKAVKSKNAAPKGKNPEKKDQGHDFTCVPLSVSTIFHKCLNADEEKMKIVEELGYRAFKHLPLYYLKHQVLKQIFLRFEPYDHTIHAIAGDVEITTEKIGKALGLKYTGSTYPERVVSKDLNDNDYAVFKDLFKRAFLIYIQKCFLLPTSAANISPRALSTIFNLENTRHQNWALHIHNSRLKEVQKAKDNNTTSVSGCCFVLMVIYFHETHFEKNSREAKAQPPWIQYWTGKTLWERMV
ncbi:hypothetical protein PIB30_012401 [Stylosanthes scabra]|uniref:Aminotransferase-like plant mobile domain-containing protein n=1 Tax=Stylosanthes scabra TaxID=79078 RepID=A0ABU6R702_9FABA|nr:hypothetical protein [Stylosanthes scabra]